MKRGGAGWAAVAAGVVLLVLPAAGLGQTAAVEGRVMEESTGAGIALAVVELEGQGAVLTSDDGAFRFDGVEPGGYELRVVAFGFAPHDRFVVVEGDLEVTVRLEVAAVPLDSLVASLEMVDLEGSVRGPGGDYGLVGADVLTNLGHVATTDAHGRFDLEGVPEGVPLLVGIRAFGYLPLDTTVLPAEDAEYAFELEEDPVVSAMIDVEVERIERRASPRFVATMRNMSRERLLRYAGTHTAWDVLLWEYGERRLDPVQCVIIDERTYPAGPLARSILVQTLPEELERIEFMFQGAMMRVYRRDFIREMIATDFELRQPVYVGQARPPFCL